MKFLGCFKFALAGIATWAATSVDAQVVCNDASEGYLLDWSNQTYNAASLSHSSSVIRDGTTALSPDAEPVGVTITFSGFTSGLEPGMPRADSSVTGGHGAGERSLNWVTNFPATDVVMMVNVSFSKPVHNLNFDILDIDILRPPAGSSSGGFRDNVVVTGVNGSVVVLPELTTPYNSSPQGQFAPSTVYVGNPLIPNRAIANESNGNGNATSSQNIGNVTATFDEPVDGFSIAYSTPSDYFNSSDPQRQGAALYDLDFCVPRAADLSSSKVVMIHSGQPVGCGDFPGVADPGVSAAIPGSCLQYDISIENIGSGISTATEIVDAINPNMIFAGATHTGFDVSDPDFDFDVPSPLSDCGAVTCEVAIRDAILSPGDIGTITIRTILK